MEGSVQKRFLRRDMGLWKTAFFDFLILKKNLQLIFHKPIVEKMIPITVFNHAEHFPPIPNTTRGLSFYSENGKWKTENIQISFVKNRKTHSFFRFCRGFSIFRFPFSVFIFHFPKKNGKANLLFRFCMAWYKKKNGKWKNKKSQNWKIMQIF